MEPYLTLARNESDTDRGECEKCGIATQSSACIGRQKTKQKRARTCSPTKNHQTKLLCTYIMAAAAHRVRSDVGYYYIFDCMYSFQAEAHKIALYNIQNTHAFHCVCVCSPLRRCKPCRLHFNATLVLYLISSLLLSLLCTETLIKLGAAFNRIRMVSWQRRFMGPIKMCNSKMRACESRMRRNGGDGMRSVSSG